MYMRNLEVYAFASYVIKNMTSVVNNYPRIEHLVNKNFVVERMGHQCIYNAVEYIMLERNILSSLILCLHFFKIFYLAKKNWAYNGRRGCFR